MAEQISEVSNLADEITKSSDHAAENHAPSVEEKNDTSVMETSVCKSEIDNKMSVNENKISSEATQLEQKDEPAFVLEEVTDTSKSAADFELRSTPNNGDDLEVVEIDLDDMGDNLDFAEIGRRCSDFGRVSFKSAKSFCDGDSFESENKDSCTFNSEKSIKDASEHETVSENQTDAEKLCDYNNIVNPAKEHHQSSENDHFIADETKILRNSSSSPHVRSDEVKPRTEDMNLQNDVKENIVHDFLNRTLNVASGMNVRRKSTLETIPEAEKDMVELYSEAITRRHSSSEVDIRDITQPVKKETVDARRRSIGMKLDNISNESKSNDDIEKFKQPHNEEDCLEDRPLNVQKLQGDNNKGNNEIINTTCPTAYSIAEHEEKQENKIPEIEIQDPEGQTHTTPSCYHYVEDEFLEIPPDFSRRNTETNVQITDLDDDDDQIINDLEIDFDDLDTEVKDAIASIDNLSSGVSDEGSTTTRRSTFKIGDDTPYSSKLNYVLSEPKQMTEVPKPENATQYHYTKNVKKRDVTPQSSNALSYKEVQRVSAALKSNHYNEPRRAIRSSVSGVDFGTIKEISRNIDMSKGSIRSDGDQFSSLGRSRSQLLSESSEDGSNVRIYPPSEKWRILKNLIFISLAFMVLFTAFNTTQAYQSSLNSKRGLGSWSLVVYYFTLMVANMFLPVIITKWLGCKGSMVVSCLLFAPYIIAQFYPKFYTLLPTSAAAGMGAGVLFCAQGTYASVMAETYMTVTGVDKETTMMLFFGIFFFLYLMSLLWGNLISAQVLLTGSGPNYAQISCNVTKFCGANFCPSTPTLLDNENLMRPPEERLYIIWGILLALIFVAAGVLTVGVDSLGRYNETERSIKRGFSGCQLLASSVKHLGNPYQLLLIPVSALGSVSEAFLEADFTYAYVACAWGIPYIGYVMICYGILLLCFTLLLGCCAVRIVGRLPLMIFCFLIYLGVLAALKFWLPKPEEHFFFFVLAGFWGIADSSTVIITAMYGIVFLGNEEAAYCNLGISRALGYLLGYIMHPLLCMDTKMIIVLVIVLVAAVGYIVFEHLWQKASKDKALAALVPFKGWVDVPIKNQPRDEG